MGSTSTNRLLIQMRRAARQPSTPTGWKVGYFVEQTEDRVDSSLGQRQQSK